MMLKSLRLKNFRKFKDASIEFPDGVTGIIGLNGAGKSTIFEAIAWTLYGPVAARTSADQIKREGADHKDPCRTELEFTFSENKYRIVREMTGKSLTASATATVNGVLAASGADIVSKFIQKRLGMDFKSFYTSIFAKQKELNALSSMNPSERKPLILRMLGINQLDDIISEIRSDTKQKKEFVEKLEGELIDQTGNQKIERDKKERQTLQKKIQGISKEMQNSNKTITKFEQQQIKIKKTYTQQKTAYEKYKTQQRHYEEKKIQFEKKKQYKEEIQQLKQKITDRKNTIQQQQILLKKKFSDIDKQINEVNSLQKHITQAFEHSIKQREKNIVLQKQIQKEITVLTQKKTKIETLGPKAQCPTCERPLTDHYTKLIQQYHHEITEKTKEQKTLEQGRKKIESDYERLSRQQQALQKKLHFLQNQRIEKEKINTHISNIVKELENEQQTYARIIKKYETVKTVTFDEQQYITIKDKVDLSYKTYQSSLESYNTTRDTIETLKIQQERKEGEKNLLLQQIKHLEESITHQQQLHNKIKEERKEYQHLQMLSEIMSLFRVYLISQIRPTLSQYASEIFETLTEGKYSDLELDENYNLVIFDNGTPYTIERFSGGEEDLANLCIRLAISEVITQRAGSMFQFIVLDEIFGSQDNIRKHNIIHALNSFSGKFRQIFLITHIEDIKNFMENSITVLEEENMISKIKIE